MGSSKNGKSSKARREKEGRGKESKETKQLKARALQNPEMTSEVLSAESSEHEGDSPVSRSGLDDASIMKIIGHSGTGSSLQYEVRWEVGSDPEDFWCQREELIENYETEVLAYEQAHGL